MNTGWVWLGLIVELGILEGLLTLLHMPTLSQWLWRQYRRHWWSRWAVLGLLIVLAIHLVGEVWGKPSPPPPPDPPCVIGSVEDFSDCY